ncbi:protein of unknown function [Thauera humireducens]|nr:protein of unknown function [Thauera humireducens]
MPVGILSYLSSDPLTEAAAEQSVAFACWARFSLQGPLYPLLFSRSRSQRPQREWRYPTTHSCAVSRST